MIKISKQNNSLIVEGIDNVFYINNGDNSYPLNSLIVVTDNSDMATFRSVATNDVLFSGLIQNITINGEAVTKDNIIQKFDAVSNSSTGGGTVDAYTKEESDTKFASKDELTNVQTVANDADTKVDALTPRVEGVETAMNNKQDTLVSGTNIKTINNQSILGEGNIEVSGVSEEQAQEIAKIPTLETELAQKANASDVPTAQTGRYGTNKNYVYSEGEINNYKGVMSKLEVGVNNAEHVILAYNLWNSTSTQSFMLPNATTSKAGIITAADKTKLDSIPENIPTQTEVDNIASNVSALQTAMDGKQPTLVSGTNIKTINNQSILGEGNIEITGGEVDLTNYYTKPEADGKFATITAINEQSADIAALETAMNGKQPTLVSGTNIKTINNESLLGEGNIEVAKKTDIPSTDNLATKDELTAVETVANNADTKADAATSRIESVETSLGNKQDTLVSGTNIKTINSQSILGSGDLTVSGVSDEQAQEIAKIPTLETELAQKANVSDVPTLQTSLVGTTINYVYSSGNMITSDNCVVGNINNGDADADTLKVDIYSWGGGFAKVLKLPSSTTTAAGVMTAADKTKLDSIPETIPSQSEIDGIAANVSALQTAMDGKQPTLVSGTNIKTINGNSILGEGNLVIEGGGIDLSNYYTKTETDTKLDAKQNTLVSGTNIKTVNSQSILGEGNLEVTIPDATTATSGAMSAADKTKLDSISNEWTGTQSEYDALTTKDNNIIYYVTE